MAEVASFGHKTEFLIQAGPISDAEAEVVVVSGGCLEQQRIAAHEVRLHSGVEKGPVKVSVGTFSPDAYFYWAFFHSAPEPYFMGGYSLLFQTSTANYYNLGFGVRYWTGLNQTFGFMAEGRHFSHINNSTLFNNQNFWEIRFGVTFRQK